MSYRAAATTYDDAPPSQSARHVDRKSDRPGSHRHAPRQHSKGADYTLVHAGHQVRIGPVAFWIVVGFLAVMAAWSLATGTYFAFHDDVLTRLIARQAQMQFAYEDRISEMRSQVDRMTSRQVLDQEQFDKKLDLLMRRQATLESRASTLGSTLDPSITGSIKSGRSPAREPEARPKPSPINDTVIFTIPPDREARLELRAPQLAAIQLAAAKAQRKDPDRAGIDGTLDRIQASLDRLDAKQVAALTSVEENYEAKTRRVRTVLADLGVSRFAFDRGVGGPFIPVKAPTGAGAFEKQVYRVNLARAQFNQFHRALDGVPVQKPVVGELEQTSPFGVRMDPFFGRAAMHTGIDFRAHIGDAVHATAAGTVSSAGWAGGYGKMVEVNHGNGLATRYGHMSEILVKVGDKIKVGQVVGRVGSTGRSTGPHLHYETRVAGEAVDPQKFLRAGIRLGVM